MQSELILVVPREAIITFDIPHCGLKVGACDGYLDLIRTHQQFLPRTLMETDFRFKQIIPYLLFEFENRYFVMQRKATASESRLQSKFTLGIGGHIRQEDMSQNSIIEWAQREFYEEVQYTGSFIVQPVGLINDDTSPVGQVHLGFLFILHGDSADIRVKSELKSGELMTIEACIALKDRMETWSSFVVDYLKQCVIER